MSDQFSLDDTQAEPDFSANDPYQILGISPSATQAEIKRRYFKLIRQYPPENEAATFKIIRGAYEKLRSQKRRTETDVFRPQPPYDRSVPAPVETKMTDLQNADVIEALNTWGDLGRQNFEQDFRDISL